MINWIVERGGITTGLSFVVAVGIPIILIFIRGSLRVKRYGLVKGIKEAFGFDEGHQPSFEFVKAKYKEESALGTWTRLLFGSLPFFFVALVGLELILTSTGNDAAGNSAIIDWTEGSLLLSAKPTDATGAVAILGFVFSGGILFSLSYLMRAVMNFELSPLSFLRVTIHMLLAAVTVVVLWRTAAASPGEWPDIAPLWFLVAFLIGFFPVLGLRYLISRADGLPLKGYRDDVLDEVRGVSVEVIDGIDAWTRFRLEESMIFDVQNLATANPIMLHVETPYGFYECIDWVAQAQLCTIVGVDALIELRRRGIRTIFDLERATVRDGATENIRSAIANVVFVAGRRSLPRKTSILGSWFPSRAAQPAQPAPAASAIDDPTVQKVDTYADGDLKHLFETMLDDLHVHRLRQIWEVVTVRLGYDYRRLAPLDARSPDEEHDDSEKDRKDASDPDATRPQPPPANGSKGAP